jgi:hypothetical protein
VWLWLQVAADPEGYVPATTSGVAVGARVTLEEARDALDLLESPDPDAAIDEPFEGRVIERVPRGFRVLSFEADRALAKRESQKATNRRYMRAHRAAKQATTVSPQEPANDSTPYPQSTNVDAPKPIPKPKPILSEEDSPLPPPDFDISRYEGDRFSAPTLPTVVRELPESWQLSDELRAEAVLAGVPPETIDQRIADLRTGTIGGTRGVLAHKLDEYIRNQFGKWKVWAETDRAKAAAAASPRRFGGVEVPAGPPRERVKGLPEWIYTQHADYALEHHLDLKRAAMAFAKGSLVKPSAMRPTDVFGPFLQYLENLAREKGAAA